jgi:endonuclease YncB( thermonuclease family)
MTPARLLSHLYSLACVLLLALIGLGALPLLSGCAPRAPLFADASPAGPSASVAVLQSDVLVIDGEAVHLADAVTPQPSPDARCAAEALAARQAALRLKALASGVRTVNVSPTGARDGANRRYAHVLLDGEDPAHNLIVDGLAVAPGGKPFDWCGPISASFPRAAHIADLSFSGA